MPAPPATAPVDPARPAPTIEGYEVDTRPPNEIPATPDLREAPEPKPAPDGAALPRLADLPAGERAALPPLRLSMHVYADDPAQRFVILDGRRLGEGASVAEGVVLQSIGREGLVLSVRGQPYWLAR
jgi:general secretion pathway protein B